MKGQKFEIWSFFVYFKNMEIVIWTSLILCILMTIILVYNVIFEIKEYKKELHNHDSIILRLYDAINSHEYFDYIAKFDDDETPFNRNEFRMKVRVVEVNFKNGETLVTYIDDNNETRIDRLDMFLNYVDIWKQVK